MILNKYSNISIEGMACAVSSNYISIESLKNGENDQILDKFIKTTSVRGRYECGKKQTAADLSCIAAKEIIKEKNIPFEKIGIVVFVSQYPDYCVPSTACIIQDRLGLSNNCIAFDINLGCSGFVYGLNIVSSLLQNSNIEYGLLMVGDTPSKGVRSDNSKNLFGDASSTTLLKRNDCNVNPISFASKTDGSGYKAICRPYGMAKHPDRVNSEGLFNEIDVFNFAISEAPSLIKEFIAKEKLNPENFDCVALHQANMMIMKQIFKRAGLDKEKMLVSIDEFANTSGASIPLCFVKAFGNSFLNKELNCLVCGYGVGLSWAVGHIYLNVNNILPLIKSGDFFDDGLYE